MVLDSSCTFHMYANRDWFNTNEKKDRGEALIGNNAACKVVIFGTVKVEIYDVPSFVLSVKCDMFWLSRRI